MTAEMTGAAAGPEPRREEVHYGMAQSYPPGMYEPPPSVPQPPTAPQAAPMAQPVFPPRQGPPVGSGSAHRHVDPDRGSLGSVLFGTGYAGHEQAAKRRAQHEHVEGFVPPPPQWSWNTGRPTEQSPSPPRAHPNQPGQVPQMHSVYTPPRHPPRGPNGLHELADHVFRRIEELEWRLSQAESLESRITNLETQQTKTKESKRSPMTDRKNYQTLDKFVSNPILFEAWTFKLRRFLAQEEGFEDYFDYVSKLQGPPTRDDIEKRYVGGTETDRKWFDEQLYNVLTGLCGADASCMSFLKNAEKTPWRGAVAWFKIYGEVKGRGVARREELRELCITDVPRATGYADAMQVIDTWQTNLRELEMLDARSMTDRDKISTLKDMIPTELKRDVNAIEKDSYDEVYEYIVRQVHLRREEEKRNQRRRRPGNTNILDEKPENGEEESDEAYSFQRRPGGRPGQAQGPRPAGGGTSTAQTGPNTTQQSQRPFTGKCFNCEKVGHRAADCPEPKKPRVPGPPRPSNGPPRPPRGGRGGQAGGLAGALHWTDDPSQALPAGSVWGDGSLCVLEEKQNCTIRDALTSSNPFEHPNRYAALTGDGDSELNQAHQGLGLSHRSQLMMTGGPVVYHEERIRPGHSRNPGDISVGEGPSDKAILNELQNLEAAFQGLEDFVDEVYGQVEKNFIESGCMFSPIPGCSLACHRLPNHPHVIAHRCGECKADSLKYDLNSGKIRLQRKIRGASHDRRCTTPHAQVGRTDDGRQDRRMPSSAPLGLNSEHCTRCEEQSRVAARSSEGRHDDQQAARPDANGHFGELRTLCSDLVRAEDRLAGARTAQAGLSPFRQSTSGHLQGRRRRWAERRQARLAAETLNLSEDEHDFNRTLFGPEYDLIRENQIPRGIGIGVDWHSDGLSVLLDKPATQQLSVATDPLLACREWRSEKHPGWVRIESVMDSGACAPVAPPSMAPTVPTRPSPGSEAGREFSCANGSPLANLGEQEIDAIMDDGMTAKMLFQLADVSRPLLSVSAICDKGNRVLFGRGGGVVINVLTGQEIPFQRRGGVYTLGFWLRDPASAPEGGPPTGKPKGADQESGFTRR